MRLAVLSDIHANLAALDAVLADLDAQPPVDATWACGDLVGYGPQPNEVIARLVERGVRPVMGNHDGAAVGKVDVAWFNDAAAAAIRWTAETLTDASRAFLDGLQEREIEGDLTAVHGSPRDPIWEYVTSSAVAAANLDAFETPICLFGHTHFPIVYAATEAGLHETTGVAAGPVPLPEGRLMLNPGSVGQPRDGNPDSSYLLIDLAAGTLEFRRVAYDIAATQARMREARLPTWLVERLEIGR
ncbi:MAG TPA: metallophosphoesterase family protein [Candidatus Limnocylindria bacterium]|jgi:diadenosine tetraphosphatase ApaH/serine/threonine PP2A family protein phosphatase